MVRPLLRFVAFHDFFTLRVENLSSLSVSQIQELERFATDRRSRLDFNTATMRIAKRIGFDDLVRLLSLSGIKADVIESEIKPKRVENQVDAVIGFGKYRGTHYKDIPTPYLLWLKKNYQGPERQALEQELRKRAL